MDFGVCTFSTDRSLPPHDLAAAAEERGFESLFFAEHTHLPVDTPPRWGREVPEEYRRTHDPFVAMTAAAMATERLRIGTAICLVAQHDPIILAKAVASLDVLSGGRVIFGIGYGWNRPEIEHHGVRFEQRAEVLREYVLAMQALWQHEEASFEGTHVRFGPSWSWPKPVQKPHPPVFIGGPAKPVVLRHLGEFAQGWLPHPQELTPEHLADARAAVGAAGRDPDDLVISVHGAREPEAVETARQFDARRITFWVPSESPSAALRRLDELAELKDAVAP